MKDNILNNFCELFEGFNQAYAVATTTQQTTNQKKVFADYTTVKKPPTQELFVNHLRGTQRFTNIPIRGDRCKFNAIDVDQYDGSADQIKERLNKDESDLPLIAATSKSGGMHLYLFVEDWVMAKDVRRLLKYFASKLYKYFEFSFLIYSLFLNYFVYLKIHGQQHYHNAVHFH